MAKVLASGHWRVQDVSPPAVAAAAPQHPQKKPEQSPGSDDGGGTPRDATATRVHLFSVGQFVNVRPRTWAGYVELSGERLPQACSAVPLRINRPGGHGKITRLHYAPGGDVTAVDVKYTLSSCHDKKLEPRFVEPWRELDRSNRRSAAAAVAVEGSGRKQKEEPPVAASGCPKKSKRDVDNHHPDKENRGRRAASGGAVPTAKPSFAASFPGRNRASAAAAGIGRNGPGHRKPKAPPATASHCDHSSSRSFSVPMLIYADDEQSMVSELDVCMGGVEERRSPSSLPPRHRHSSSPSASSPMPPPRRQRRPTLETSSSHTTGGSSSGRRSSPCSKARSIASGQVLVVEAAAAAATASPGVSPRYTKTLAVGRVAPSDGTEEPPPPPPLGEGRQPGPPSTLLHQVYQSERRRAYEFVREVVVLLDRRDDDGGGDDAMSVASAEVRPNGDRRAAAVAQLVSEALADRDGVLQESEAIDPDTYAPQEPPLTPEELRACVSHLCDANKLMVSDGHLYSI